MSGGRSLNNNNSTQQIQFYKERIREKLLDLRDDIGEMRFKLYMAFVAECESYSELREMAEMEMQIELIEYTKTEIKQKLKDCNVCLDELRRVSDTSYNTIITAKEEKTAAGTDGEYSENEDDTALYEDTRGIMGIEDIPDDEEQDDEMSDLLAFSLAARLAKEPLEESFRVFDDDDDTQERTLDEKLSDLDNLSDEELEGLVGDELNDEGDDGEDEDDDEELAEYMDETSPTIHNTGLLDGADDGSLDDGLFSSADTELEEDIDECLGGDDEDLDEDDIDEDDLAECLGEDDDDLDEDSIDEDDLAECLGEDDLEEDDTDEDLDDDDLDEALGGDIDEDVEEGSDEAWGLAGLDALDMDAAAEIFGDDDDEETDEDDIDSLEMDDSLFGEELEDDGDTDGAVDIDSLEMDDSLFGDDTVTEEDEDDDEDESAFGDDLDGYFDLDDEDEEPTTSSTRNKVAIPTSPAPTPTTRIISPDKIFATGRPQKLVEKKREPEPEPKPRTMKEALSITPTPPPKPAETPKPAIDKLRAAKTQSMFNLLHSAIQKSEKGIHTMSKNISKKADLGVLKLTSRDMLEGNPDDIIDL